MWKLDQRRCLDGSDYVRLFPPLHQVDRRGADHEARTGLALLWAWWREFSAYSGLGCVLTVGEEWCLAAARDQQTDASSSPRSHPFHWTAESAVVGS